jgi:nifR3 family TIM-barrel protein
MIGMLTLTQTLPNLALEPMHIGSVILHTPLTLAPMAGVTNHAFRSVCVALGGCGLVCTELISSMAIHYRNAKTKYMFDWTEDERPVAVQLFGADPAVMGEAARIVADLGADIVDINMGCWVPKVAKTGAGAALLRDVCTAGKVVEAVVNAVSIPVTVKVRAGWDAQQITAVEFARVAEAAGVQAIAVHARTAEQGFTGVADWSIIRRVKEAVTRIPVIGNGDVIDTDSAREMFTETGCDGVMIGRAALGDPWIFRRIAHELRTGLPLPEPTVQERADMAIRLAEVTVATSEQGERHAVLTLRGQLPKYTVGFLGRGEVNAALVKAETLTEMVGILSPYLS